MSDDWKSTEWQDKAKHKPVRYWIRDEIEEIIKEENIDRKRFYEASKNNYQSIINKFYYSFIDYEDKRKPDFTELSYLWLSFRKDLEKSPLIRWGKDYNKYIGSIAALIPDGYLNNMHYLILSHGWVYEGYITEIIAVLKETDGWLDDFYVVSKKYDYVIVHTDDGECMYLLTK